MAEEKKHQTRLTIVTPYENFFEGSADAVILPSRDGEVGIMAGHMPLVLALFPGILTIRVGNEKCACVISEGYAEIGQHMVLVVTNSAEWPDTINVKRSFDSLTKYTEMLKEVSYSDYKATIYKEYIDRAKARLHLIELYGSDKQKEKLAQLREAQSGS